MLTWGPYLQLVWRAFVPASRGIIVPIAAVNLSGPASVVGTKACPGNVSDHAGTLLGYLSPDPAIAFRVGHGRT
jgi:hypothetical protein